MQERSQQPYRKALSAFAAALVALSLVLCGCDGSSGSSGSAGSPMGGGGSASNSGQTSGDAFVRPKIELSEFDPNASFREADASIDVSHVSDGYVAASAKSPSKLKFEVASGGMSMYYDLPNDGTPIACPLSMGNGSYKFAVWENTSGSKYAEVASTSENVTMSDEFEPYIRPSVFCEYDSASKSTQLANDLTADAQNEGDVVQSIYNWVVDNISYDEAKAQQLSGGTGYIPNPDSTIAAKKGICFDYASLVAAMLRSQGIPCKIITGNVSPDDIYHAWNMIYINGTWVTASIDVRKNTWTLIDSTFASSGNTSWTGDGSKYTERYTY